MAIEKYRVHEVAKDFGVPTKTITEILTKYASAPKNHMQVLTDHELSVIFDCLTQQNPVSDIQVIFQDTYQESAKTAEAAPASGQKPAQPSGQKPAQTPGGAGQKPAQPQASGQKPASGQPAEIGRAHV